MAYNTLLQIRNNAGADLSFIENKQSEKLYINANTNIPQAITIEYIPLYESVEEVTSDY